MAKKMKSKRRGFRAAEVLYLVEPCGEVCGVHKGILCPECGEFAAYKRNVPNVTEDADEGAETSALRNEVFHE